MRSHTWLTDQLNALLKGPFADLPISNRLEVHFGRLARRRFGSITMTRDKKISRITINGLFRNEEVPEEVVQATLAHELSHYAHGFSSPLPRLYKTPHAGGVIEREFKKRGLSLLSRYEKEWTRLYWATYLRKQVPMKSVRRSVRRAPSLMDQLARFFKP